MSYFVRACTAAVGLATALGLAVPGAGAVPAAAETGVVSGARAVAGANAVGGVGGGAGAGSPVSAYPSVGRGTHFLDDSALLGSTDEKGWYEANIPFLDVPDQTIQSTYYYRWRVWKEHVRPTGTANATC